MRVGIATDHGGLWLKEELLKRLGEAGHEVIDFGAHTLNPGDDYPDFVTLLARAVATRKVERGVAVCGSGVGASVCANKIPGVRAGYLFGRNRVSGPDPGHGSYRSFASFRDPDGNGWLLQEVTTRLPGRIDSTTTNFASVNDLASALRRAEAAHGEHEKRTGQRDENWPAWYAEYMVREQNGQELPQ